VVFELGEQVTRHAEWDTWDNPRGERLPSTLYWPISN
jgi:hypothetical protein